jgi:hypothetical protein
LDHPQSEIVHDLEWSNAHATAVMPMIAARGRRAARKSCKTYRDLQRLRALAAVGRHAPPARQTWCGKCTHRAWIHLKLDELLRAEEAARTGLVGLERLTDEELARLEAEFERVRAHYASQRPGRRERSAPRGTTPPPHDDAAD